MTDKTNQPKGGARKWGLALLFVAMAAGLGFLVVEQGKADAARSQDATYTCPMHPTVKAREPGKCPICGMYLARVDASSPAPAPARDPARVPAPAPARDPVPVQAPAANPAVLAAYAALYEPLVAGDAAKAHAAAAALAAAGKDDAQLVAALRDFPAELKAQRARFSAISERLIARAGTHPGAAGNLEVVYCSMAPGRWLQPAGPVRNPYFGAEMLACGEVQGNPATAGSKP